MVVVVVTEIAASLFLIQGSSARVVVVVVRGTVVVVRGTFVVVRGTVVVGATVVVVVVGATVVVVVVDAVVVGATVVVVVAPPPDEGATVVVVVVVTGTVTVIDCGEPVRVVCALPAVSVIENDAAAVKVEVTAPPPAVAVDVAVIVHTVDEVCAIPVIDEMPVKVKSVPDVVDKVEQSIASLPVTVKVIVAEDEVAADLAKVTVGAVVSITIALLAPSELVAPGEASVSVALFKAASRIVPLFNDNEFVAT